MTTHQIKIYLHEALGSSAAGLVVFSVGQALLLLAIFPAQSFVVTKSLHSCGEHLVDGQRGLSSHTRFPHPQFYLCIAL